MLNMLEYDLLSAQKKIHIQITLGLAENHPKKASYRLGLPVSICLRVVISC